MRKLLCLLCLFVMSCYSVHASVIELVVHPTENSLLWLNTGLNENYIDSYSESKGNFPAIIINFNKDGKEKLKEITTQNVGRPVGILLNGNIISEPVVQEPITDGSVWISAENSMEELKNSLMNAGIKEKTFPINIIIIFIGIISIAIVLKYIYNYKHNIVSYFKTIVNKIFNKHFLKNAGIVFVLLLTIIMLVKMISDNKLPTCDSDYAIEQVREYYSDARIGLFYATDVTVSAPVTTSYDKDIKKYECKAHLKIDYHCDSLPARNGNPANSTYEGRIKYEIYKTRDGVIMYFRGPFSWTRTYRDW